MRRMAILCGVLCGLLIMPVLTLAAASTPSPVAKVVGDGHSRTSPLPFGKIGTVGDYHVRVIDVTPNANDVIQQNNQFNEPPVAGNQFFMVRIGVGYHGTKTGTAWTDLSFSVVGKSNRGYNSLEARCGDIPDPAYTRPELFPGGTDEFNVCWSVPASDVDSLVMYVGPLISLSNNPVWFSLTKPIS